MKTLLTTLLCLSALSPFSASACTLKDAREHLSTLNSLVQILGTNSALHAERTKVKAGTAAMRKLFAKEVEKKSSMLPTDQVDPRICDHYNRLAKGHDARIADIKRTAREAKAKTPVCRRKNIRKRFGAAIRTQRKLTIAGKIDRKTQIKLLNIATDFNKNSKSSFQKACLNLHEYEKHLSANEGE